MLTQPRPSGKIAEIDLNHLKLMPGSLVLDVGCARGYTLVELAKRGCMPFGLELLPNLVQQARDNVAQAHVRAFPLVASAEALPFGDETFDAVICTEVIEHVPNAERLLDEIQRILRREGRLCLAMPTWFTERLFNRLDKNFAAHSGHLRVFGRGVMASLLSRRDFQVEVMQGKYFEWSLYWLFRTFFLKTEPVFYENAQHYERLDYYYKRLWRGADRLGIGRVAKFIGNRLFPKSHYFYCRRV